MDILVLAQDPAREQNASRTKMAATQDLVGLEAEVVAEAVLT